MGEVRPGRHICISCITPTYNRRAFVPQAIDYFLRQDYPDKELIVVDDGSDPVADLIPSDERIRYIRLDQRATVGAKRNIACEAARGEIIAHWDDDDWHAPYRLSYQAEELLKSGKDLCGLHALLFYEPSTGHAWKYLYPGGQGSWLGGNSLCYRRAFWSAHPFPAIDIGEDTRFLRTAHLTQLHVLSDPAIHVGIVHSHNISPKQRGGAYWHDLPTEHIQTLMGMDWYFYHPEQGPFLRPFIVPGHSDSASPGKDEDKMPPTLPAPTPAIDGLTVARVRDMALSEFVAFNHGQALPTMRRWEQPFVLFQARLGNTMAVLDCTINPVNFEHMLKRLFPHTNYQHWNPIQNGEFRLPVGVPDSSFDRVICVNTLEHLPHPQRIALLKDLECKLKPGGLLLLTSDYYFDSAWRDPNFLKLGVMRPDRQEIFNGWNRVTFPEWLELTAELGLKPLSEAPSVPQEDESGLYLNTPPFVHACIGGVFYKPQETSRPASRTNPPDPSVVSPSVTNISIQSKRIVLSLLTWNTCTISIESLLALVFEARLLKRLGHEPFLCVVDNGSDDGTPNALRQLITSLDDVPHYLILNEHNVGSSIARNQIIDYALNIDADYVLFIDGDIEIVPFSSFAMLRYMENQGRRVGVIGADHRGHTPDRQRASTAHYSIDNNAVRSLNLFAWTQYGMFRRTLFDEGIRFEVNPPFDQPGWGFEDNDLAFQIDTKGYLNHYFSGMVYLHRALHSSVDILRQRGHDPATLCSLRQQYVINKWAGVARIDNGPLREVRRFSMRL